MFYKDIANNCNTGSLSIDVSEEQHRQIKALGLLQGKSIKALILDKIFDADTDSAWDELMQLLDKRILDGRNGGISPNTPYQITARVMARNKTS